MKNYKFYVENLDCANCAKKIEQKIASDERFQNVILNFNTLTLTLKTKIEEPLDEIYKIIKGIDPSVLVYKDNRQENKKDYEWLRLIIAIIFIIISFLINNKIIKEIFIISSYLLLLYKTFLKAMKKIIKSHNIDENLLITISAIGAYILGEHMEGLMVVLLYVIGKILEDKAVNKSRNSIKNLLDLKVDYANLKLNDEIKKVKSEELKVKDIIIVKKGETIPVDGVILDGEAILDTSSLTGESVLEKKTIHDHVLSGSINKGEVIELRVEKTYYNSTAYKILELTINATNNKAKTETFVSKIASYYTPIILGIAIIIGALLPLAFNISYQKSIYRALTFLVISCPCAIAISVPLSYFAGIGISSKNNALVKGSNYLDELTKCNTIVFDKTGTITKGAFKLSEVKVYQKKYTKEKILDLIAKGETFSNHPIAKLVLNEVADVDTKDVKNFKEIEGKGITYQLKEDTIKIGSSSFVNTNEKANIFISINDAVVGGLIFSDNIKENAKEVIYELKKSGLKTIMLTGDHHSFAKIVADEIGIDHYEAELLPDEKYKKLQELMKNNKVIFVGDGINDTPSIVLSNVGISMGSIGSNSAIDASDIVIMNDDLSSIVKLIHIAKKTSRIIKSNLIFAIATKITILSLATFGFASMWLAIFADTGVTLLTIINSLRILKVKGND